MDEKQNGKSYSVMELRRVYHYISEVLEERKKKYLYAAYENCCDNPIGLIDEILRIDSECAVEKDKWLKVLRLDEIQKGEKERFEKAFGSVPVYFKNNPFNRGDKK